MRFTVTKTADELFMRYQRQWPWSLNDLDILRRLSAAGHISRVNCDEMARNRPRQLANRNCYKLSRVSWAFLKLLVSLLH